MKILITHELFLPDRVGGGEMLMYRISKELIKKGHSVKVLTTGNPKIKKYDGIKTIRIPVNRYMMNLLFPIIAYHARDVDVIQTSSGNMCFPSWVAAKILNKPVCCYVHHIFGSYWKDVRGKIIGRIFEFMEKLFLNRSYDAIIFQNKTSRELGIKMGIKENIFLSHPGIDYKKFQMKNIKKENMVLFVGNLCMNKTMSKIKGLEYFIDAARKLPELKFVVVGEGEYLNTLKETAPPNITFTGGLTGKPLVEQYNKASIFCLPSLTEGFGLTLLEAMASGCAITSTVDIGQSGLLIKPKNTQEIVDAVKKLIDNPRLVKKIGRENKKLAKKFMWNKFIKELIRIYNSISK